jgi:hypothetical protein
MYSGKIAVPPGGGGITKKCRASSLILFLCSGKECGPQEPCEFPESANILSSTSVYIRDGRYTSMLAEHRCLISIFDILTSMVFFFKRQYFIDVRNKTSNIDKKKNKQEYSFQEMTGTALLGSARVYLALTSQIGIG